MSCANSANVEFLCHSLTDSLSNTHLCKAPKIDNSLQKATLDLLTNNMPNRKLYQVESNGPSGVPTTFKSLLIASEKYLALLASSTVSILAVSQHLLCLYSVPSVSHHDSQQDQFDLCSHRSAHDCYPIGARRTYRRHLLYRLLW